MYNTCRQDGETIDIPHGQDCECPRKEAQRRGGLQAVVVPEAEVVEAHDGGGDPDDAGKEGEEDEDDESQRIC